MIKSVFLDLDDTLLDFWTGESAALRRALLDLGMEPTEAIVARYHEINIRHWELLEEKKLTREEVLVGRFAQLFAELGVQQHSAAQTCERYERYLSEEHELLPGAWELMEELYPQYDLYLASNGAAAVQYPRLEASGLRRWFKDLFISEKLGAYKPSVAFFEAAFARIPGFQKKEAIIVGDSLTSDIRGGIDAGIRTCWFNPHKRVGREDIRPDFEITQLGQLPALLKSL